MQKHYLWEVGEKCMSNKMAFIKFISVISDSKMNGIFDTSYVYVVLQCGLKS